MSRSLVGSSSTQHVGGLREQAREHQAVPLPARQLLHRRLRALAREQEIREVADDVPRLAVDDNRVVAVVDGVGDGPLGIELLALLIEVRNLQARALLHFPRVGLQRPHEQPQQRRLARIRWDR